MSSLESQEWWEILDEQDIMVKRVLFGSYSEASQKGLGRTEQNYIERRAKELRSLGLDPENTYHWRLEEETLQEIHREADSVKWLGHPDATREEINIAENTYALRQMLSEVIGQNYME